MRPRVTPGQKTAALATLLIGAGALHMARPELFDPLVPPQIPGTARGWTYASGAAELGVGLAIAAPATRRLGAGAAAALFVAVFPANVYMALRWRRRPLSYRAIAYGRLPLQIPLVLAALDIRRSTVRRAAR
ncbi:DoxX family protein [Tomitella biformata]|uniref:DoxX family protein n=1 Tax=Tomitella biformata TaxID=630403 RepID=UPI00056FA4B0|nr:membrane protein [Tomitella biformata]